METKICSKCKRELTLAHFNKNKKNKDGLRGECRECQAKQKREYREKNKEKISKYNKEYSKKYNKDYIRKNKDILNEKKRKWYEENREEILKYKIEYRENNKRKILEYNRAYSKKNRDRLLIWAQKRRTIKKKLPSELTEEEWENTKRYFDNSCAYCGRKVPLSQEHFIPLSKGGEYTVNNIIPSCKSCNSSKKDKDFFLWYPKFKYYSKQREKQILDFLNYSKNKCQQLTLIK